MSDTGNIAWAIYYLRKNDYTVTANKADAELARLLAVETAALELVGTNKYLDGWYEFQGNQVEQLAAALRKPAE